MSHAVIETCIYPKFFFLLSIDYFKKVSFKGISSTFIYLLIAIYC